MTASQALDKAAKPPGLGVWGNIRSVIPRWNSPRVGPGKPEGRGATPAAALVDAPPREAGHHLERLSSGEIGAGAAGQLHQQLGGESAPPRGPPALDFGYPRGLEKRYRLLRELGRGGNGVVRVAEDVATGTEYALKSIPKQLTDPKLSDSKRNGHAEAVKREVEVLRRLRGCLNVASLEAVFEDDSHVHLVLEYCKGGELAHRIGETHYSERTVASYMRAVLRTLAQCHSQGILHRDIKPGNFLLASSDPAARLKAIDFGLAVFFEEGKLPRTDLGLEGTPWFMAPETLRSEVYPASDVWAAAVMVHQLLTGRFPFDDKSNPFAPSLSKVWRSIMVDELDFTRSHWAGISSEAKDFVRSLLHRDPAQRPTALQALQHPWLQGPGTSERSKGRPLALGVVQRIQRYSQGSAFKRSVLDMIAEELLREGSGGGLVEMAVPIGRNAAPIITDVQSSPLEYLYEHLSMTDKALVDRGEVADGLEELGYKLSPEELERLLDQLDPGNTGKVAKSQMAASQIDWRAMQQSQTERWLKCARRAFSDLDVDGDGFISSEEMVAMLRNKLPKAEVEAAVRHALQEAARRSEGSFHRGSGNVVGAAGDSMHSNGSAGDSVRDGMSFRQFVRMLRAGSTDCLDLYDDRQGSSLGSPGSLGQLSLLDASGRGNDHARSAMALDPIKETI